MPCLVGLPLGATLLQDVPVRGSSATAGLSGGHKGGRAHRASVPVAPRRPYGGVDAAFLSHEDHKTLGPDPTAAKPSSSLGGRGGHPPAVSLTSDGDEKPARGACWERSGDAGLQGMPGARGVRCMLGEAPRRCGGG